MNQLMKIGVALLVAAAIVWLIQTAFEENKEGGTDPNI